MLTIQNPTCNHQTAPLGIDDPRPVFAWQYASDQRNQQQAAFRLLVASSFERLRSEQADLWDTGRVVSGESVQLRYIGQALQSRQRYYWKVNAWDQDGQETGWSAPAWFEMGLLEPEDWRAQWITHPDGCWNDTCPAPFFRKHFVLESRPRRARVYLCGLGYYELYLNGQRVGDHVLDPAFTRYDKRVLYVAYDVTGLLQAGENAFGVVLGNGLFNQAARDAWSFEKSAWRASPRLLFQGELAFEDGNHVDLLSDGSWKVSTGPIRFDATRLGEVYDARLELPGWNAPGYDDSAWLPARITEGPRGKLTAQSLPPVRVTETLVPARVWKTDSGSSVYDLGQNITGWARLRLRGPAGTEVILRYGELLTPTRHVDLSNINHLVYEGEVQVDRYILKGQGEEVYEPRFTYHGFQYIEVEGAAGELGIENLQGRVVGTDFQRAGRFRCSNETINRLQSATEWSYRANFVGYPHDCPHREKNGWTGDTHLAAEAGLYLFHGDTAYRKWLDDLADEQREDGSLPGIVPTSGWGYAWGNGPCWDSACVLIPWYLYLYRGDRAILERSYPVMRRYLEYLGQKSGGGGLIALGLGDWLPPYGQPEDYTAPLRLMSSAYFYMDALIASKTAAMLGYHEDAYTYAGWAEALQRHFNEVFFDPISALYAGGSQTALGMALYAGLVDPDDRPRVARQLAAEIRQQKGRLNFGIHGAKAVLNALAENGFHEQAITLIIQPRYPGWGWWIAQGATTLWESWNGKDSHNHIAFGDISAIFFKYLAGIRPDPERPGFKNVIIRPVPVSGLNWVRAEHEGPYGTIRSAWHKAGSNLHMEVSLPVNTTGLVYLPKCAADSVRVGQTALEASGLPVVNQRMGGLVVQVGSGEWVFDCTLL